MKNLKTILSVIIALASFNAYALPIAANDGSDFTIIYDGIGGDPVMTIDGLSASVRYNNFMFVYDGTYTNVTFDFEATNTSSSPVVTSRISTLGFNTTPDIVYNESSVSGAFNILGDGGTVPNQGSVEFCFKDDGGTNSCASGGNGGIEIGDTGTGSALLAYLGEIATIDFDKFTIRYQSLNCVTRADCNDAGSASGSGDVAAPEVLGIMGIGLMGILLSSTLRRRKIS